MPATGALFVNDVDVATLGLSIGRPVVGAWDGPDLRAPTAPLLGRLGRVSLTGAPPAAARLIVAHGHQSAADTASLQALEDALKRLVGDGIVRVRLGDHVDREWEARGRVVIRPLGAWQTRTAQEVDLSFDCDDPIAQAVTPRIIDFSGGATECPLGTAVSQPIIRIGDSATNPVVTLRDHRGQVVQTMGFVATIGAGDWYEIDCEVQTIVDQDGANQALTFDGATNFLSLNPYNAAGTSGPWPTLESSSGSLAISEYRERYL